MKRRVRLWLRGAWLFAWLVVQAKAWTVRTTRVPAWWAAVITFVSRELAQPLQPVLTDPSPFVLIRLPALSAPTPK